MLARYTAGEYRQVWRELAAADPLDGAWREEADLVAAAVMVRVRRNAERLVAVLVAKGWPLRVEVALPGLPDDTDLRLRELEELSGSPVPSALKAFWRTVGSINLVPANAELPPSLPPRLIILDPLEVESLSAVWSEVDEWRERASDVLVPIETPLLASPTRLPSRHLRVRSPRPRYSIQPRQQPSETAASADATATTGD